MCYIGPLCLLRLWHIMSFATIIFLFYTWKLYSSIYFHVTGGTLEKLIEQDGALPESCVREFGKYLVEGTHAHLMRNILLFHVARNIDGRFNKSPLQWCGCGAINVLAPNSFLVFFIGLHAIHSLGLVFCDLRPSKLLLDGEGGIKYSDFSLARVEGESLEELLSMFEQQTTEDGREDCDSNTDSSSNKNKTYNKVYFKNNVSLLYTC